MLLMLVPPLASLLTIGNKDSLLLSNGIINTDTACTIININIKIITIITIVIIITIIENSLWSLLLIDSA